MTRILFTLLAGLALASPLFAQAPSAEAVKSLHAHYADERAKCVADKADKAFVAGLLERSDELAQQAETAAGAGRLFQAAELYRQARWNLPYLPAKLPEHVARVLGNFRLRHGMEVTAAVYSPDGQHLASGSADRSVKIWDLANGREVKSYTGHGEHIRAVAFSPDGTLVASAGGDPDIHLWNAATGELVKKLPGPGNYVTSLAFSRDGKTLVSGHSGKAGGTSGYLAFDDVASGERKRLIQDFRLLVASVAFSTKGDIVAVGVADGALRLYSFPKVIDNANEPEYWAHQDNGGQILHIEFSADDKTLIRCGDDGIKVYAVPQPAQAFQVSAPKRTFANPDGEHYFRCAMTSADSKTLIAGGSDGVLRMFDLETGQPLSKFRGHSGPIRTVAMHPKGTQIASAGADCMTRLWDFDIVLQARNYVGHDGAVWSAAFSPDGKRIVSASSDQTVRLWDVGSPAAVKILKGHAGPVTQAMFTPDGKRVVSAGADRVLKIWNADTAAPLQELTGHTGTITAFDISPDGKRLVSGGADRQVKIWNLDTNAVLLTLPGQTSVVSAIAFAPSGETFAVGNVDQTIALYDMSGKMLRRWAAHGIAVSGLAFSPNGRLLASCGADTLVRVWSLADPGAAPVTLMGHVGPLSSVAFRKDNQHLVSCGADLSIKLWQLEGDGGKEQQAYRGHRDWVASAAFSRDGHYVVSASVDRTIKVWEITSRDVPAAPEHSGVVTVVAVSPDGKRIATGSSDRTIRIWDRGTGQELSTIRAHASSIISLVYTPDGKTLISSGEDKAIRFWDIENSKELPRSESQQHNFTGMVNTAPLLSLSPNGKRLLVWITGGEYQNFANMVGYDLEGHEQFTVVDGNDGKGRKIYSLCFSADGGRAATGGSNGVVRMFDLEKQSPLPGGDWFVFDKSVAVADLALTPDGKTIIVTSEKGEIKIGDVGKRDIRKTIQGHSTRVASCLISPDAKRFATLDTDNTIKLWDLQSGEELRRWDLSAILQSRSGGIASLTFSPDGKSLVAGNGNSTIFVLETGR